MIRHKWNGFLAEPYSIEDLKNGISWILSSDQKILSKNVRNFAKEMFCYKKVTESHINLFRKILLPR